jgi:phytanoyl-CoA hydroxylase
VITADSIAARADHLRADYDRDGYLVLEDFVSATACATLIERAEAIVAQADFDEHRSVFTTHEQERTSDEYFLASGGETRFFFESEAFGPDGALRVERAHAVNKLGHAMHDQDPVFDAFSRTPELAALAAVVGLTDPLLLQSMYIFKNPYIGG